MLTRDSALWLWGRICGIVTLLITVAADPDLLGALDLGLSESTLRQIQVVAGLITFISAQNSNSSLPGKESNVDPRLSKILKVALEVGAPLAVSALPGGSLVKSSVEALINKTATHGDENHNGIPDDEEAILNAIIGGVQLSESVSGRDLINDPVLQEHGAAVLKAIEAFRTQLIMRSKNA